MAGYTRNDTSNNIATGNVINAADLDGEFDALVAAFHASTGHTHDGTAANGAPITKIGPVQDLVISTGAITPKTDNTVDLGSSSFEFKDLYIDGTANIDALVADTADINAGTIDGTAIGANSASTGAFTTLSASSTVTLSGGTANGVLYLNGSKVATSGSALTFNGTQLTVGSTSAYGVLNIGNGGTTNYATAFYLNGTSNAANGTAIVGKRNGTDVWLLGDTAAALGSGSGYITYVQGDNPIISYINASEQMRLTSTGLGIGTSSPGVKLDIFEQRPNDNTRSTFRISVESAPGNQYAARIAAAKAVGGQPYMLVMGPADNNGHLAFTTGASDTERMRIDASGNLGLGVTPSAWDTSIFKALQVGNGSALFGDVRSVQAGNTGLSGNVYYSSGAFRYINNNFAGVYFFEADTGIHAWSTAPSGTAGNAITFTKAMTLDASGNLLVGTTANSYLDKAVINGGLTILDSQLNVAAGTSGVTPFEFVNRVGGGFTWYVNNATNLAMTLDASGNLGVGSTTPSGTAGYRYVSILDGSTGSALSFRKSTNAEYGSLFATASDNSINLYATLVGPLIFGTSGVERARITSGGELLIGTTTNPQVSGYSSLVNIVYPGGSTQYGITLRPSTDTTTAITFCKADGTIIVGSITQTTSATAYNTSSDYRLKDNPQPLTGSGAFIDALKPKTWNWKADGSKGVGFIAHEVQEVSPGSVVGEKDGEQMQAMEYGSAEFIANIIAELQSLRQRVALLEGN